MSPTDQAEQHPVTGSDQSTSTTAFKDLCLDVADEPAQVAFWSAVLGLVPDPERPRLTDEVAEHAIWLNVVPEARAVKNRVHLDVHTESVEAMESLGATVLRDEGRWTVMADPEGGELCAFVRAPQDLSRYRLYELGVDSPDPEAVAGWWAVQLGATAQTEPGEDFWSVEGGRGLPWPMVFASVPEPKTVKNRLHWDVWGDTDELLAAGARLARPRDEEISWDVLTDPDGNEFCVFRS